MCFAFDNEATKRETNRAKTHMQKDSGSMRTLNIPDAKCLNINMRSK